MKERGRETNTGGYSLSTSAIEIVNKDYFVNTKLGIHTIEECPHVLQFAHLIIRGSSRSANFFIDFLTKTLFDVWVFRQHVEREG